MVILKFVWVKKNVENGMIQTFKLFALDFYEFDFPNTLQMHCYVY